MGQWRDWLSNKAIDSRDVLVCRLAYAYTIQEFGPTAFFLFDGRGQLEHFKLIPDRNKKLHIWKRDIFDWRKDPTLFDALQLVKITEDDIYASKRDVL